MQPYLASALGGHVSSLCGCDQGRLQEETLAWLRVSQGGLRGGLGLRRGGAAWRTGGEPLFSSRSWGQSAEGLRRARPHSPGPLPAAALLPTCPHSCPGVAHQVDQPTDDLAPSSPSSPHSPPEPCCAGTQPSTPGLLGTFRIPPVRVRVRPAGCHSEQGAAGLVSSSSSSSPAFLFLFWPGLPLKDGAMASLCWIRSRVTGACHKVT